MVAHGRGWRSYSLQSRPSPSPGPLLINTIKLNITSVILCLPITLGWQGQLWSSRVSWCVGTCQTGNERLVCTVSRRQVPLLHHWHHKGTTALYYPRRSYFRQAAYWRRCVRRKMPKRSRILHQRTRSQRDINNLVGSAAYACGQGKGILA